VRLEFGEAIKGTGVLQDLAKLDARTENPDFVLSRMVYLLYAYWDSPQLPEHLKAQVALSLLNFKYWIDEPGPDGTMQYWTENHQIAYHAGEYLIGNYFREDFFPNSNMTGTEHAIKGKRLVYKWLYRRWRFGFAEFNSDQYAMVAIQPLIALANFAPDVDIRTRASSVLDLMIMDLIQYQHKGHLGGPRGRVYTNAKLSIENQSPRSFLWLLTGEGELNVISPGIHTATVLLALGADYRPPAALLHIGEDRSTEIKVSGRSSFDVAEGPYHGFSFDDPEDCIFWLGMAAYSHPLVIECMFIVGDAYDMWDHSIWTPLQPFKSIAYTGIIPQLSSGLYPLTKGSTLGEMKTYSYKTPDAHLSSVRDYNKGLIGIQQHVWQATLDDDALLWGTHPGPRDGDHASTYWTGGGSLPRVDQHESVLIALYNPTVQGHADALFSNFTHAFFPIQRFDDVQEHDGWVFGRKGDGYVAVWSPSQELFEDNSSEWSGQEIRSPGVQSAWIVEVGRRATDGSFQDFQEKVSSHVIRLRTSPPSFVAPSGLLTCLAQHPECLEGFPEDINNLLGCVQSIPIINPNPVCGNLIDLPPLLTCAGRCDGSLDALCLYQCVNQHVELQIGKIRSGEVELEYLSHRTGKRYLYSWDNDMSVVSIDDGSVVSHHEMGDVMRYDTPYAQMKWGSDAVTVEHCGESVQLDFLLPRRDCSS